MARIHNIYEQEVEKVVEEDRPKIMASGVSSHNMHMYQQPYDQPQDGELSDQNGRYLTHYKGNFALYFMNNI